MINYFTRQYSLAVQTLASVSCFIDVLDDSILMAKNSTLDSS